MSTCLPYHGSLARELMIKSPCLCKLRRPSLSLIYRKIYSTHSYLMATQAERVRCTCSLKKNIYKILTIGGLSRCLNHGKNTLGQRNKPSRAFDTLVRQTIQESAMVTTKRGTCRLPCPREFGTRIEDMNASSTGM